MPCGAARTLPDSACARPFRPSRQRTRFLPRPPEGRLFVGPALDVTKGIERQLAAVNAPEASLDVPFEMADAHPQRLGGLPLCQQHPDRRPRSPAVLPPGGPIVCPIGVSPSAALAMFCCDRVGESGSPASAITPQPPPSHCPLRQAGRPGDASLPEGGAPSGSEERVSEITSLGRSKDIELEAQPRRRLGLDGGRSSHAVPSTSSACTDIALSLGWAVGGLSGRGSSARLGPGSRTRRVPASGPRRPGWRGG